MFRRAEIHKDSALPHSGQNKKGVEGGIGKLGPLFPLPLPLFSKLVGLFYLLNITLPGIFLHLPKAH